MREKDRRCHARVTPVPCHAHDVGAPRVRQRLSFSRMLLLQKAKTRSFVLFLAEMAVDGCWPRQLHSLGRHDQRARSSELMAASALIEKNIFK